MKTIRLGTFETNSSSTHTLAILPNSANNVPIGQTIELKLTKINSWEYEQDWNYKLISIWETNRELTLKYLKELNINVTISISELSDILNYLDWNNTDFELPLENLNNFTSYIWGNTIQEKWDNNLYDEINNTLNHYKSQGYLTSKYDN